MERYTFEPLPERYTYKPLAKRHIRLLELTRHPEDNHLQGTVIEHNLDKPLRYEALS